MRLRNSSELIPIVKEVMIVLEKHYVTYIEFHKILASLALMVQIQKDDLALSAKVDESAIEPILK